MRDRLNCSEFSATAFWMRRGGTRLVMTAWYVGADWDWLRPVRKARSSMAPMPSRSAA